MEFNFDLTKVAEVMMDLPFATPHNPGSPEAAMKIPGCCLKYKEIENGAPKWHGRLVSRSKEKCIVVSHRGPTPNRRFVWTGTEVEFLNYWDCD
jgi:hypothetical protein